jgi:hypothetical protein
MYNDLSSELVTARAQAVLLSNEYNASFHSLLRSENTFCVGCWAPLV